MSYKKFLFIICAALASESLMIANPLAHIPIDFLTPYGMSSLNQKSAEGIPLVHFQNVTDNTYALNAEELDDIIEKIFEKIKDIFPLDDLSEEAIIYSIKNLITVSQDITKIVLWFNSSDKILKLAPLPKNIRQKNRFIKNLLGLYHMSSIAASELIQVYNRKLSLPDKTVYAAKIAHLCSAQQEKIWTKISPDFADTFESLREKILTA